MQKGLRIKDEVYNPPIDARISKTKSRENTVRWLSLIALSVICLDFVRVSFLQNPKKILGHLFLTTHSMQAPLHPGEQKRQND